jgi:nucleotide-binding universal stress UspA family protein
MRILIATDGSRHSLLAEALLAKLPQAQGAKVDCAHAVPSPFAFVATVPPMGGLGLADQSTAIWEAALAEGRKVAEAGAVRMRARGFDALPLVLEGDPGNALLDQADSQYDLIVLGSRGQSAIKSFLLGSVARKLLSHSPVSLLIARCGRDLTPEQAAEQLEAKAKLDVLVAVDGSAGSINAVQFVSGAPDKAFGKVVPVCVHPLIVTPTGIEPSMFRDTYDEDEMRAKNLVSGAEDTLARVADEVVGRAVLARPAHGLIGVAEKEAADLLVIGATRHGALERFFIGSVSYEVATEAPCSVLVVRRKG